MFKLYSDKGTRTQLDESNEKYDIIQTMGEELKHDPEARFLIIQIENKTPMNIELINGLFEYALYVEEYNARLKQMSCIELKKEIVGKTKIKKK